MWCKLKKKALPSTYGPGGRSQEFGKIILVLTRLLKSMERTRQNGNRNSIWFLLEMIFIYIQSHYNTPVQHQFIAKRVIYFTKMNEHTVQVLANLLPPPRKMRYKKPGYHATMTMHVLSLQSNVSSYKTWYQGCITILHLIGRYISLSHVTSSSFLVPEMVISDSKIGFSWLFSVFLLDTSCST